MNPSNDKLVNVTAGELSAIVAARRKERPRDIPPRAATGFSLTAESRLWYVAEFIYQARLAKRNGKPDLEQSWRDRAQAIATAVAGEANADLLRAVANALDGKHPPAPKETDQQRILTAIAESYITQGRAPSNKELRETGLSGRAINAVLTDLETVGTIIRLHTVKRGRKPLD